jgi:hypothetical protein
VRQTDRRIKQQISFRATCWALQKVLVRNTPSTEIILVYRVRTFCDFLKCNYVYPTAATDCAGGRAEDTNIRTVRFRKSVAQSGRILLRLTDVDRTKHACMQLNIYGDNDVRNMWSSCSLLILCHSDDSWVLNTGFNTEGTINSLYCYSFGNQYMYNISHSLKIISPLSLEPFKLNIDIFVHIDVI